MNNVDYFSYVSTQIRGSVIFQGMVVVLLYCHVKLILSVTMKVLQIGYAVKFSGCLKMEKSYCHFHCQLLTASFQKCAVPCGERIVVRSSLSGISGLLLSKRQYPSSSERPDSTKLRLISSVQHRKVKKQPVLEC